MGTYPTDYETVKKELPDYLDQIEVQIRSGNSKAKNDPMDSFLWFISHAERINGMSFGDMMKNVSSGQHAKDIEAEKARSIDEKIEERLTRSGFRLYARKNRYERGTDIPAKSAPKFVLDEWRAMYEKEAAEQARVDALTPEERDAEVQESLKELRKYPGFMEVNLPL